MGCRRAAEAAALVALVVLFGAACSSDDGPAEPQAAPKLVVERRAMTRADELRLDPPEGEGFALGCTRRGQTFWDYGAFGPDDPRGRTADDALRDAISDLDAERDGDAAVPRTGWVELRQRTGASTFVQPTGRWRHAIVVSGRAQEGVWRRQRATICIDE